MSVAPKLPRKRKLLAVLRPLFAVVLLAAVAYFLPWSDELVWREGTQKLVVRGTIEGDWRSGSIHFRPAENAPIDVGWPETVATPLARHESVAIVRAAIDPPPDPKLGAFDWRPGMPRVFREMDPGGLVAALGMLLIAAALSVTRWWRLLAVAGCPTSWWNALRLTFLGFFFNLVVPGLTGGDVIKAVLVVRENPERRADALVTVIVDRGLGLVVLVGLAAIVVLLPGSHFGDLRWPVLFTFAGMLGGILFVLHPGIRRMLGISKLLEKLPQQERLKSVERSFSTYSRHPLEMCFSVVLSVMNHSAIATAIWACGHAFGDSLAWPEYLGITAIANTVSSLPLAPGGWGVGEALFGYLFHVLGGVASLGVAVSVSYRLLTMVLNLSGGIFLLLPSGREARAELDRKQ